MRTKGRTARLGQCGRKILQVAVRGHSGVPNMPVSNLNYFLDHVRVFGWTQSQDRRRKLGLPRCTAFRKMCNPFTQTT